MSLRKFQNIANRLSRSGVNIKKLLSESNGIIVRAKQKLVLERDARYLSNPVWQQVKSELDFLLLAEAQNIRVDPVTGAMLNVSDPTDPDTGVDNRPDLNFRPSGEQTDGVLEPFPLTDEEESGIEERNPDSDRARFGQENATDKAKKVVYGNDAEFQLPSKSGEYASVVNPTSDVTSAARDKQDRVRDEKAQNTVKKSTDGVNVNVNVEAPEINMPEITIEQPRQDIGATLGNIQHVGGKLAELTGTVQTLQMQNSALSGTIQTMKSRLDQIETEQSKSPKVLDDHAREIRRTMNDVEHEIRSAISSELDQIISQRLEPVRAEHLNSIRDSERNIRELAAEVEVKAQSGRAGIDQQLAVLSDATKTIQFEIESLKASHSSSISNTDRMLEELLDRVTTEKNRDFDTVSFEIQSLKAALAEVASTTDTAINIVHDKLVSDQLQMIEQVVAELNDKIEQVRNERKKFSIVVKDDGDLLKESIMGKNLKKLMESELQQAEVVLAAKSIVNDLQGILEKLSNLKIKNLLPVVEQIRTQFGVNEADKFNDTVSSAIDTAIQAATDTKDAVDTEVLRLTGDVPATDLETDMQDKNTVQEEPAEVQAPEELGESKIGLIVEMNSGIKGKKFFESKQDMRAWLNTHGDRIRNFKKI